MLRDPLSYFVSIRERLGDTYTLDLGLTRFLALNHPRHAQYILRDQARNYTKGGPLWESFRDLIGNGLPTSEGDFWLRQRRMMQPQFHKERLAAMADTMVEVIDDSLVRWGRAADSGEPLDIFREVSRITMDIVVKVVFGADISPEETDAVSQDIGFALDYMLQGLFTRSLPGWLPVPGRKRFNQAVKSIDDTVFRVIERHRHDDKGVRGSLIEMLLDMVDAESGERMTDKQLRDEAVSMFIAGYETTAETLAFAFDLLGQRPDIRQALREECDAIGGGHRLGFSDLHRMPLALMVLQETMRLYPPAYWIPRTAVEDDVIDGFHVPSGAMVGVMTYVIHRHPEMWEDPERFDPWRFTAERSANRHPLAWIPFGVGQRLCLGRDFALMEGQLILARALASFEVEPLPRRKTQVRMTSTLRPSNGVWVRLSRRRSS